MASSRLSCSDKSDEEEGLRHNLPYYRHSPKYSFQTVPGLIPYVPKMSLLRAASSKDLDERLYMMEASQGDSFPEERRYPDPDEGHGRLILKDDIILDNMGSHFKAIGESVKINMSDFSYISELGRGEQGRIFMARHVPSDTEMAVKEIPLEMSQKQMKNILIELEVLSKNKSPFIIHFFGAFYTKSSVYFSMEVMNLGSIDDLIKMIKGKGPPYPFFPDTFITAVVFAVSSGLYFVSKKLSIIHRDIKPTNILLDREGNLKICDFGVSGYLIKSAAKTYVGSMTYMAPERVRSNQSGDYTTQADVWSLGATLYELVLGAPLYAVSGFDSAFAHLMAISMEPCPNIPMTACSPEMGALIRSFLAKKPEDRPSFQTLVEMPMMEAFRQDHENVRRAISDFLVQVIPEEMHK